MEGGVLLGDVFEVDEMDGLLVGRRQLAPHGGETPGQFPQRSRLCILVEGRRWQGGLRGRTAAASAVVSSRRLPFDR